MSASNLSAFPPVAAEFWADGSKARIEYLRELLELVSKAPPDVLQAFARQKAWHQLDDAVIEAVDRFAGQVGPVLERIVAPHSGSISTDAKTPSPTFRSGANAAHRMDRQNRIQTRLRRDLGKQLRDYLHNFVTNEIEGEAEEAAAKSTPLGITDAPGSGDPRIGTGAPVSGAQTVASSGGGDPPRLYCLRTMMKASEQDLAQWRLFLLQNGRDRMKLDGMQDRDMKLPLSLWGQVFSFMEFDDILESFAGVNRTWFQIAHHPDCWLDFTRISAASFCKYQRREIPPFVFRRLVNLTHVDLPRVASAARMAELIATYCPRLRVIDLAESPLSHSAMVHLARCANLEEINFEYCGVDDAGMRLLLDRRKAIRKLNLSRCNVSDKTLRLLADTCPDLEWIELEETQATDGGVIALAERCTKLRSLTCYACNITDLSVRALAQHCPRLYEVDVGHTAVTPDGVRFIVEHCHELRRLRISHCRLMSDDCLRTIADCCPDLEGLTLGRTSITDVGLRYLSGCPNLQHLDIRWCTSVTSEGLHVLAQHCRELQSLYLIGTNVTVEAITLICSMCTKLKLVDMRYCPQIPGVSVPLNGVPFPPNCKVWR